MRGSWRHLVPVAAGLMLGAMLSWGMSGMAGDINGATEQERILPYEGLLDLDGVAFEGMADIKTVLVNQDQSLTWEQTHEDVPVQAGRFALQIGSGEGIPAWIFDASVVYLRLEVRDSSSEGDFAALGGLQVIEGAPSAFWTSQAHNMMIGDNMTIAGGLTVTGATRMGNLEVSSEEGVQLLQNLSLPEGEPSGLAFGSVDDRPTLHSTAGDAQVLSITSGSGDTDTLSFVLNGTEVFTISDGKVMPRVGITMDSSAGVQIEGVLDNAGYKPNQEELPLTKHNQAVTITNLTSRQSLGSTTNRFCVLSSAWNQSDTSSFCEITEEDGEYILYTEGSEEGSPHCSASCATW